jgi:hypothetical protein
VTRPSGAAVFLAIIPFVAICFTVPIWDRVQPMMFGLPFNFFWLLAWIVLTSACLRIAYRIELRRERSGASRSAEARRR